ncbi:MAG: fumarylacetoacetate hydrolase family protein [Halobacteriales archaeon]|nr:fumarylacetoacetate hydrolase family protein [Halobacteriales archaeon]
MTVTADSFTLNSIGTFVALGGTFSAHKRYDATQRWPFLWTVPDPSIVPDGDPIRIPADVEQVAPGPELCAVIAEPLWQAEPAEATDAIAGFTISNDIKSYGEFPAYPYEGVDERVGRGYHIFPTFTPTLGSATSLSMETAMDLRMETYIDGEQIVDTSTAEMGWTVAEMVAHVSRIIPLDPNDVVSLGDPTHPDTFLDDADSVTCRIEAIGELTNSIIAE